MSFNEKDISIVIPTYNRHKELEITIKSILNLNKKPKEILVIDQSTERLTKKIKGIKYIYSKIPSITIARNIGIKNVDKNTKIILFLDDDVTLDKKYLENLLEVYNEKQDAIAVAGYFEPPKYNPLENFAKKMFLLQNFGKSCKITSPFGNTYPKKLNKIIKVDWMPGVNMSYKKEVFNNYKFDEKLLGYTIAEDIGFSYRLKKAKIGEIYLTPKAKIIHRASQIARENLKLKQYINTVDHLYFYYNNKKFSWTLKLIWNFTGIIILRTIKLLSLKKNNFSSWFYFMSSLIYGIKNYNKIKKGELRGFK